MANVTKLMFNYSSKKSKNYNSVEESEGFEMQVGIEESTQVFIDSYTQLKELIRNRVDQKIEEKLNQIPEKKSYFEAKGKLNLESNDDLEGL